MLLHMTHVAFNVGRFVGALFLYAVCHGGLLAPWIGQVHFLDLE